MQEIKRIKKPKLIVWQGNGKHYMLRDWVSTSDLKHVFRKIQASLGPFHLDIMKYTTLGREEREAKRQGQKKWQSETAGNPHLSWELQQTEGSSDNWNHSQNT